MIVGDVVLMAMCLVGCSACGYVTGGDVVLVGT